MTPQPVVVEAVTRHHRSGAGIFGVSLGVGAGETVALAGPDRSGRTALMRVLATIDSVDEGSITWFGQADRHDPAVRRRLGVVLDATAHFEQMTGYQNAWFFARRFGVTGGQVRERLNHLFTLSRLGGAVHRPVHTYTAGMRRRLALVEALCHEPGLLLVEEPLSGLDPEERAAVLDVLERAKRSGVGVVVSTSDARVAAAVSDRALVLSEGRVVRCASTVELVQQIRGPSSPETGWSRGGNALAERVW